MTQQTSLDAWDAIQASLPRRRGYVLGLLRSFGTAGATADQLVEACNARSHNAVAPRLTELSNQGLIVDSGKRRTTRSGQLSIVWELTSMPRTAGPICAPEHRQRIDWKKQCAEMQTILDCVQERIGALEAENDRLRALLVTH